MRALSAIAVLLLASACRSGDASLPEVVVMTPDSVRSWGGDFSPDGSRIAYWSPSKETRGWDLWVANADMTNPVRLPVKSPFFDRYSVMWSPDGTHIAATSGQYGTADVVVVPAAGGQVRRLTTGPGFQGPVQWHPTNPDLIAYYSTVEGGRIVTHVVSLSTGEHRPLIPDETRPYAGWWSPDGSRIAYMVWEGGTTLWTADSAGNARRQLTTEGFENIFSSERGPWSPDGRDILYQSQRTGTTDLWLISADGGEPRQLTRDIRNDGSQAWSEDGNWIAFRSDRGRQWDVWVIPAAGGTERRVTDTEIEETRIKWRPGTRSLVMVTRAEKSSAWSVSTDAGGERQLTPDSLNLTWQNLSPDGKTLAYVVDRGARVHDLVVSSLAGGAPRTLIAGGGTVEDLAWSPDGSRILFLSDRGGSADVWVINAAGGSPGQLVNWPSREDNAIWSGDGSAVYFLSTHESRLGDVWSVSPDGGEPKRVTRTGNISSLRSRAGVSDLLVGFIGGRGGAYGIGRLTPDGSMTLLWDSSTVFVGAISPSGDEVTTLVEKDGQRQSVILPFRGGPARALLEQNEFAGPWSNDGRKMLFYVSVAGAADVWVLDLETGSRQRLTATAENETGAGWGHDDQSVFFRRVRIVEQISTVDVSKTLKP
ncbi:MAG: hypothetical protein ACSLFK_11665 [Gemmatimonadaceae bacterium]